MELGKDWVPVPWSWGRTGYLCHGAGEGLGTCAMELGKDWVPVPWSWGRTGYLCHGAGEGLGTCAMELGKDYPEPTTMERVSAVTKVTAKAG